MNRAYPCLKFRYDTAATVKDIREMVEDIADVRYINLPKDREADRIRGFGFVDVASPDDIPNVVDAINGLEMDGRRLRASRSLEKDQIRSTKREGMMISTLVIFH